MHVNNWFLRFDKFLKYLLILCNIPFTFLILLYNLFSLTFLYLLLLAILTLLFYRLLTIIEFIYKILNIDFFRVNLINPLKIVATNGVTSVVELLEIIYVVFL